MSASLIGNIALGVLIGEAIFAVLTTTVSYLIARNTMKKRQSLLSAMEAQLRTLDAQGETLQADA